MATSSTTTTKRTRTPTASQTTPSKKKTIAEMVLERKHMLEKQYSQTIDSTIQKIYDTAVKLVEEMPVTGDITVVIYQTSPITVDISNGKSKPVKIKLEPSEVDFDKEYMQKKFISLLEKMLNSEGFHKSEKRGKEAQNECMVYCTCI